MSGQAVSLVERLYEERVDSLPTSPGPPSRSSSVGSEGLPAGPPSSTRVPGRHPLDGMRGEGGGAGCTRGPLAKVWS